MSAKYPRNLTIPDRPCDFKVPGFNCDLALWFIKDNYLFLIHTNKDEDTLQSAIWTWVLRRTKHGKWFFVGNSTDSHHCWQTLNHGDDNIKMQSKIESAYQNYLLSKQIENSLTENNIT